MYELWDIWVDSASGDQKWPNVRGAQDGCWKFHVVWYEECQGARVWCLRMDSTLFTQARVSSWQFRFSNLVHRSSKLRNQDCLDQTHACQHQNRSEKAVHKVVSRKHPCALHSKLLNSFESLNLLEYGQRHGCHDSVTDVLQNCMPGSRFCGFNFNWPGSLHSEISFTSGPIYRGTGKVKSSCTISLLAKLLMWLLIVRPTRQQFPYAGAFFGPHKYVTKMLTTSHSRLMSGTFGLEIWLRHISKANEAETTFRLWGFHAHPDFGDRYDVRCTVRESEIWRSHDSHLFENLGHVHLCLKD